MIVNLPGRAEIYVDGDDVEVALDPDLWMPLEEAGSRGLQRIRDLELDLEADVSRVLGTPAYRRDAFDGVGDFRVLPGTITHRRAALLSLAPDAEITFDDEDEVEAILREFEVP